MPYQPQPIDTLAVTLTEEIRQVTEQLAENTHDLWALKRLTEGWRHGSRRDDIKKEHPCLVPYGELPESEKEYDRHAVLGTLKALLALGYGIEPPASRPRDALDPAALGSNTIEALIRRIEDPASDLVLLLTSWRERDPEVWFCAAQVYRSLGERLLRSGSPLTAHEVVTEGLENWPRDRRLRQLQGLALARSGATERAIRILGELEQEGHADEETLGLLARSRKDLGVLAADSAERQRLLRLAYQTYASVYRHYHSYWAGINTATLALLLKEKELAQMSARTVQAQCLQQLEKQKREGGDAYWVLATLGEAALLLDAWSEAEDWYSQAARVGCKRVGDLNSTRRNARLILGCLGRDRGYLDRILRIPRVVVFTGHMIDRPGRARVRFPPQLEPAVSRTIRDRILKLDGRVGYASAACGSDILFLESLLELGGEANIVLPYDKEPFARDSVNTIPEARWEERYAEVLRRATQVVTASSQKMEEGSVSYDYANLVLHGLASVRAAELETELVALAVWDGKRGDGPGGTAALVDRWQHLGLTVEHINLSELLREELPQLAIPSSASGADIPEHYLEIGSSDTSVMAMLFADAVNYSKLTEEQVPRFVKHFLVRHRESAHPVSQCFGGAEHLGRWSVFRLRDSARCRPVRPRSLRPGDEH